jgi:WD40 repeat protein
VKTAAILEPRGAVALGDYVLDCAWSGDSARIAAVGGEGGVFIVEAVSVEAASIAGAAPAMRGIGEHPLGALGVSWQRRGETFATCGQDGAFALWDAQSGIERSRVRPGRGAAEHVAFSPDGKWLACASGRTVSLWSYAGEPTHALERAHEFEPAPGSVAALAWDKPGRDLAAATNGGLIIHRIEPPRFASRSLRWDAPALTAAFSPNGKLIACGTQDGTVHFWNLTTGRDSQMRGYGAKVQLTAWSANSRYLATSAGTDIIVWDFSGRGPEGSRPVQLVGHTERITALAFHPSGPYLVTGGRDWRLSLWVPGKAPCAIDAHLASEEITVLRFSPDGRLLAVGERSGKLAFYELKELER